MTEPLLNPPGTQPVAALRPAVLPHLLKCLLLVSVAGVLAVVPSASANQATSSFVSAKAAFEDEFYESAESGMRTYLETGAGAASSAADRSEAVSILLQSMARQDKFSEILSLLAAPPDYLAAGPPGTVAFWTAFAHHRLGDHVRAIAVLGDPDKAFADSPLAPQALRLLAQCRLRSGDRAGAALLFRTFDERYPDSPESPRNLLDLAEVLLAEKNYATATDVLTRLIGMNADTAVIDDARYWLGRALTLQGQYAEATNVLITVSMSESASPNLRAEALFTLGGAHLALNDRAGSIGFFEDGIRTASGSEVKRKGKRLIGTVMVEGDEWKRGIRMLREVVNEAPMAPAADRTQLLIAQVLAGRGQSEQSLKEYQFYLETFTNTTGLAEARVGKAREFLRLGRYSEAADAFMKAQVGLGDPSRQAECLLLAGRAFNRNGQFQQAVEAFDALVADHADSGLADDAAFERAESLFELGEIAEAESAFRLISTNSVNPRISLESLIRVAELKWKQGELAAAVEVYSECLARDLDQSERVRVLTGRGTVVYELGRFDAALEDFKAVMNSEGGSGHRVRYLSALCHYWLGDEAAATEIQESFVSTHTNSVYAAKALFWLGNYDFNAGRFSEAEARFLDYAKKYDQNDEAAHALLWAGRAAYRQKEFIRAIEIFGELVKAHPESPWLPEARFEQGNALVELAKFDEAILVFQDLLNRFPEHDIAGDTWLRLGDCQFMLGADGGGRYETARASYRSAAEADPGRLDLVLHAEYKSGRCLEKLEQPDAAVKQYYENVIVAFLAEHAKGTAVSESARMWFWRAAREAAAILESREEWRKAVSILDRVIGVGVPAESVVQDRIRAIKAEHWWEFY